MPDIERRRLLGLTATGLAAGLAGCGSPDDGEGTEPLETEDPLETEAGGTEEETPMETEEPAGTETGMGNETEAGMGNETETATDSS